MSNIALDEAVETEKHTGRPAAEEDAYKTHLFAGAVAGVAEHAVMFPVDTIKTRMQALAHPGQRLHGLAMKHTIKAIIRREGLLGLYGGFWAVASTAGPVHAVYFAAYEMSKEILGGNQPGHHPVASASAASIATIISDGLMTPFDVIKQRLQVANSPYKGILDCARRTLREDGISTFYRSYRTTLIMNVPFVAVHLAVYESAKKFMSGHKEESLAVQLVAGGLAGGTAAAMTNPLDMVKTRLQLEGVNSATKYGTTHVLPAIRQIVAREGQKAMWSGVQARVCFHLPASAICWGTYETVKALFFSKNSRG